MLYTVSEERSKDVLQMVVGGFRTLGDKLKRFESGVPKQTHKAKRAASGSCREIQPEEVPSGTTVRCIEKLA